MNTLGDTLAASGVSRRAFLKFCVALTSLMALPPSMASTSPSGHASTQVPHPIQDSRLMWGCWARGPSEKSFPCSAASMAAFSRFLWPNQYRTTKNRTTAAATSQLYRFSIRQKYPNRIALAM